MQALFLLRNGTVVGYGTLFNGNIAVPRAALSGVVAVSANSDHSVALTSAGAVLSWGGDPDGEPASVRNIVPAFARSNVTAIAAGADHTLVLLRNGTVACFGFNNNGQCNVPAGARSRVVAIAAGQTHSLAVTSAGGVLCWGNNGDNQVRARSGPDGVCSVAVRGCDLPAPLVLCDQCLQCAVPASARSRVVAVAGGTSHSLALLSTGQIVAWGDNTFNQTRVPAFPGRVAVAIAAGDVHSVAIVATPGVFASGEGGSAAGGQGSVLTGLLPLLLRALCVQRRRRRRSRRRRLLLPRRPRLRPGRRRRRPQRRRRRRPRRRRRGRLACTRTTRSAFSVSPSLPPLS